MQIVVKNKDTLLLDEFKFKCSSGKKGATFNKIEGDLKTPKGTYSIGPLFYRKDKIIKLIPN
jgi:L,D-peptidoglycan transpeptidase YkuD (ErfK/YbiS/YcfS/YnhG family)